MDNQNTKILIIEDDQFLRDFYQELISAEGYQVDTAVNGEEGLDKILSTKWNLVLLDIMLPKKDGLHVLKDLKDKGEDGKHGPIVLLTNLGNDAIINQAFQLGASGYLVKSALNPAEVLNEVKDFLNKVDDKPPL